MFHHVAKLSDWATVVDSVHVRWRYEQPLQCVDRASVGTSSVFSGPKIATRSTCVNDSVWSKCCAMRDSSTLRTCRTSSVKVASCWAAAV